MSINFAAITPHPPILLPSVGSKEDRLKVKKTLATLDLLTEKFKKSKPDSIIISSPHPDWGVKVPLHFLKSKIKKEKSKLPTVHTQQFKMQNYQMPNNVIIEPCNHLAVHPILTTLDSPKQHYEWGQKTAKALPETTRVALIASGDLSHCLKEEGPYGFHPDGPKFDRTLTEYLKKKDVKNFLKLDEMFPRAGECGLRSFCFLWGILDASKLNWQPEILSYEGPFGVGYLVVNFKLKK